VLANDIAAKRARGIATSAGSWCNGPGSVTPDLISGKYPFGGLGKKLHYLTHPEAAKGMHGPIVPQGGAEKHIALPRGKGEASAKGIVERGCFMHTATGYKCSVAIARHGALR
jgi:hypothetical protein